MATPGQRTAQRQAALRRRQGPGAFVYKGAAYDCTSKALDADKRGELIEEAGVNITSVDQRLTTLNPSDFPSAQEAGGDPIEGDDCDYQGHTYTIKKVMAYEVMAGVPIALPVVIYRTPQADAATDAPVGEVGAGTRKTYYPPAQQ